MISNGADEIRPDNKKKLPIGDLVAWTIITLILGIAIIYSLVRISNVSGHERLEAITICLTAFCTLVMLTFLYKENPVYRIGEHIIVGLGLGFMLSRTISGILIPNWWNRMVGANDAVANWWWLLVIPPGLMVYTQLSKKYMWLFLLNLAFFIGMSAGGSFRGVFNYLLQEDEGQIPDTIRSVAINHWDIYSITESVFALTFVIVCLCTLSYFFFSFRHAKHKLLRNTSKLGRIFLMISFGAIFGTTVQGRTSLFIDRLRFIIKDWLKL